MEKNISKFLKQSEKYLDGHNELEFQRPMFWGIQELTKNLRVVKTKEPGKVNYKFVGEGVKE